MIQTTDLIVAFVLVLVIIQASLSFLNTETSITANMVEKASEQKRLLVCSEALIRNPNLLAENTTGVIPQHVQNKVVSCAKPPCNCSYGLVGVNDAPQKNFSLRRLVLEGDDVKVLEVW